MLYPSKYESLKKYPYVVHRIMSTVYRNLPVVFLDDDKNSPQPGVISIVYPDAFVNAVLTDRAREILIEIISQCCIKNKTRMCVVFGEADCVYCEPDGLKQISTEPPGGGLSV